MDFNLTFDEWWLGLSMMTKTQPIGHWHQYLHSTYSLSVDWSLVVVSTRTIHCVHASPHADNWVQENSKYYFGRKERSFSQVDADWNYYSLVCLLCRALARLIREAFKKNNNKTYGKFHILGGGSAGVHFPYVITKDFKCTESHFEHF